MTEIFGIDLGTTYSAVAQIDEFGKPVVIPNHDDQPTTPSAVYFESADNVAVGQTAKNTAKVDPVVMLIKRKMGGDYTFSFHGDEYTPESISALILKQLMKDAVERTGIDTNRVVITVPACFGTNEKDSTRKAGVIAGLEVVDIIEEPVAASLAYGINQTEGEKTVFVYDLGGGTFDTTILKITPDLLEVLVIDGDRELGGADWDEKLTEHLIAEFKSQTGARDEDVEDEYFLQDVSLEAEEVKKSLTKLESKQAPLRFGSNAAKITVTRQQFEDLTVDLLNRTLDIVERTLEAGKAKDPNLTIDEVLLVGGSSFMPAVKRALNNKFGWNPLLSDPNLAVAKGAAIYGRTPVVTSRPDGEGGTTYEKLLPGGETAADLPEVGPAREIKTAIPRAIGIGVWCGHESGTACEHSDARSDKLVVSFFIHKNDPLPFSRKETFGTVADGQTQVAVHVFEQLGDPESELIAHNKLLTKEGGALITDLPNLPKNSPIDVQLDIDKHGQAHISATDMTSGKELKFAIDLGRMQEQEVQDAKKKLDAIQLT
jgi:molecular chaperone DnaK